MKSKSLATAIATIGAFALFASMSLSNARGQDEKFPGPTKMSAAEFDHLFKEINNWGRWGKDDTLGTVNLITDAKRKQAASLVKTGITVSIAHDLSTEEAPDNPYPIQQVVAPNFRTDTYFFRYHGTFITHEDALCHYTYNDRVYNDRPLNTKACFPDIDNSKDGIVTRGILIDIPRLKGLPYLEPEVAVYPKDIEAWEKMADVKIGSGDAIILRTGRWAGRAKVGHGKLSTPPLVSMLPWRPGSGRATSRLRVKHCYPCSGADASSREMRRQ